MNIVIVQGAFFPVPPIKGGAVEKMWFKLAQEFVRQGHQVVHISKCCAELPQAGIIEGVSHFRVPGFHATSNRFINNLLDAIYTLRVMINIPISIDIIVTNSFWAPIFLGIIKKWVIYVDVARMPKGQLWLYGRADRLRANSAAVLGAIQSELKVSQYARAALIPNPLPFKSTCAVDLLQKAKIILYCGRVHEEKGLWLLAEAVRGINLKGWRIQIVGPWSIEAGGSGQAYKKYLTECFQNTQVDFLGPIYDEDLLGNIYRQAAIFVYPSIAEKGETFGLAPLEAMAWGAATIVSDLECFKDFIEHQVNGLVFDHRGIHSTENLLAAIERLTGDDDFRNYLALNATNVRKSHSVENIASIFIDDFCRLTSARGGQIGYS